MSENIVVIGDIHGQLPLAEAVRDQYAHQARCIFAGDVVDGPDVREVLDVIRQLGATIVIGNHEQYLLAAMLEEDPDYRRDNIDMWAQVHRGTLESYSLYSGPTPINALRLRDKMDSIGHLRLLEDSQLYFENDQLVVVHGDITAEPWLAQCGVLEHEKRRNWRGQYWGWSDEQLMPPQLGEDQTQVTPENLAQSGLTKRLLSGHFHLPNRTVAGRYLNDGQHVLLAGDPSHGFTFAYESWTQQLRIIEAG